MGNVTNLGKDSNGKWVPMGATTTGSGESASVASHPDAFANERNAGTSNQYGVGVDECNATVLSVNTAVQVSSGAPSLVFGVMVLTVGTTVTIVGLNDETGTAQTIVLAATTVVNTYHDLRGMKVNDTFTVTASVADDVVVFWRPQS